MSGSLDRASDCNEVTLVVKEAGGGVLTWIRPKDEVRTVLGVLHVQRATLLWTIDGILSAEQYESIRALDGLQASATIKLTEQELRERVRAILGQ